MLDRGAFDLDRILEIDPDFLDDDDHDHDHHEHDHDHHDHDHDHTIIMARLSTIHDETVQSVSLRDRERRPEKFFPWIESHAGEGPNILRSKGILAFKDDADRYVIQGVHMIIEGDHQRAWKDGETRESRLVFIGRNLKEDELRQGFLACAA